LGVDKPESEVRHRRFVDSDSVHTCLVLHPPWPKAKI